jgi:hypothetical protein
MRFQGSSSPRICLDLYYLSLKVKALRFRETSGTTHRTNYTVTSPKRRKTPDELHMTSSKRPKPLTERTTRQHTTETSGTTHRTNYTATHLRNIGKHERTTHDNTSPKRPKPLTERTTHGNTPPKRREQLTDELHGNTYPKRRKTLTGRTTQHIYETSGTIHRTNDIRQLKRNVGKHRTTRGNTSPKRRERLAEGAAHGNISESSEHTERGGVTSETSETTHRTSDT